MKGLTAYERIAREIEEKEPHTAPKAADGSIHEAFLGHLELVYSPEEAEVIQHLNPRVHPEPFGGAAGAGPLPLPDPNREG